ncbi:hypothetical protein [Edaphobacillus lindanitolerans]|uniref:Uncharacterized protein n=1 Tax=Edaphobacillus lindanitolerans TaxID=550447 RepID=A0A1U7PSM2_9BACI|nr:hypothetical protein [Edaphobacillus lindanitolerans]SIT90595.1 hypothetical protein SAMN05428946_2484 [Edaphobacillus lindanitolerans]
MIENRLDKLLQEKEFHLISIKKILNDSCKKVAFHQASLEELNGEIKKAEKVIIDNSPNPF